MIAELWTGIVSHMKSPETDLPQGKLNLLNVTQPWHCSKGELKTP